MEGRGRLVKNPSRVPVALQRADPVGEGAGRGAAPVAMVRTKEETEAMPKIDKTGIYEDADGNRFYYVEGTPVTDEQKKGLRHAGDREPDSRERRSRGAAPENRMAGPAPENRGLTPQQKAAETRAAKAEAEARSKAEAEAKAAAGGDQGDKPAAGDGPKGD